MRLMSSHRCAVAAVIPASIAASGARASSGVGGGDVAGLSGDVDIATLGLFAARLRAAIDADPSIDEVQVDFADVSFIGIGGTRLLVAAAATLRPGRQLVVLHPPWALTRILEIAFGQIRGLRLERAG